MKVYEILECDYEGDNYVTAKKIALKAKQKAKKANPGDEYIPSGWDAGPHQGSHASLGGLSR